MSNKFEEFLSRLDPKTAGRIKVVRDISLSKYPLSSIGLTNALNGGIGAGRITLVYGNQSAGKSLLMLQSIAMWQKMGLQCAYVDTEGTVEPEWAERLGVDVDCLIWIKARSSGKIEKEIRELLEAEIDILVIDTISDILPEVFIEKDGSMSADRKQIGAHAKAITNLINGIHYINERTAVILLSQTTTKIEQTYVQQVPHGGQKTLFASSQIVKLTSSNSPTNQIKGEVEMGNNIVEIPVGRKVEYYVEKNKLGPQAGKGSYNMYYTGAFVGIDGYGEVIDLAELYGLVEKTKQGRYTDISTGETFHGKPKFVAALKADDKSWESLCERVKEVTAALPQEVEDDEL